MGISIQRGSGGGGGAPSGAAGGDLTGTYPNPTLADNSVDTIEILNNAITSAKITAAAVTEAKLGLSDVTTADVTTAQHGFAPKAPNDTTKFLRGDATWAAPPRQALFTVEGVLVVADRPLRIYNKTGVAWTISSVFLSVSIAPTGASIIADVNKNGTTIYTTQANRPSIAASANTGTQAGVPDVTSIADGDYLTIDVDAVGSTVAGSDLTVHIIYN